MARASKHTYRISRSAPTGSDQTIECIGVGAYDMRVPHDLVGKLSISSGWWFYKGPTRV